jgi:hypothetical protein
VTRTCRVYILFIFIIRIAIAESHTDTPVSKRQYILCSLVHKICLLFTELDNEDKHIFRDGELRKESTNFKQTQRNQII